MAKISKKILGFSRGKVADVVFAKFRTETIARGYQPNVRNPRTESQQEQRARFATASGLAKGMVRGIYRGLASVAAGTKMSPRNVFMKLNCKPGTIDVSGDSVTIEYTEIALSQGNFETPLCGSPLFDAPNTVEYSVTNNMEIASNVDVVTTVYCPEFDASVVSEVNLQTSHGTIQVSVPASWGGVKVHVYSWLKYTGANSVEDGLYTGVVSETVYVGNGTIA